MGSDNGQRSSGKWRIGAKQTLRAIEQGTVVEVFVAQDADPLIVARIVQLCKQRGIQLTPVDTMRNLGRQCGIDVGAATAAIMEK